MKIVMAIIKPFKLDEVRDALTKSEQLWVLASPDALKSTWVHTEWGAAWILNKPILPILFRLQPDMLPDRLRMLQVIDYHNYPGELKKLVEGRSLEASRAS